MWIKFSTDGSVTESGFVAYFVEVDDAATIPGNCSKPIIDNGSVSPSNDSIAAGESYTVICDDSYTIDGNYIMECNEDGTLSAAPTCTGW